jgi:O-methyltransferase/8-demethyl-8-(2,3-dimethoxy-alpha-L-rhamnosyl)tetracenomycin-C 4'-O-methyltransferase
VDIVIVQPQNYPHSAAFAEVAETLKYGLLGLGYEPALQINNVRSGVPTIVLGGHLLSEVAARVLPAGATIYNLEQLRPGAESVTPQYMKLLGRHAVWDFDIANIATLTRLTGNRNVRHVPLGFAQQLARITSATDQDIDVLFYGSMTPRRQAVLHDLTVEGLKVSAVFGVYGSARDELIARAKVVLNLHAVEGWGFEIARVSYLLTNRKAVVTEVASAGEIDADLQGAFLGVPYAGLVPACVALAHDDAARTHLEQDGFAAFSRRDETEILRRALTSHAPVPIQMPEVATDRGATLRGLYLDLLARCLTNQIYGDDPIDPWSGGRFDPEVRRRGADWPSRALTMIGDRRLDNIRRLFEAIVANNVAGDLMETGVWRGGACIFMRGLLKAYEVKDRRVWLADSFSGVPAPDGRYAQDRGDPHHRFPQLSVSVEDVKANFRKFDLLDDQVVFLEGWFAQTLPAAEVERLALLRLDGDMYGSTMDALSALYGKISRGGFVIVDDFGAIPPCRAAVIDFRTQHGISAAIHDIDGSGVFWQVPG